MCQHRETCHPVLLGATGMGVTSTGSNVMAGLPTTLQEVIFHESTIEDEWNPFSIDMCPGYAVCTEPITEGGNICTFDYGGPLYQFRCGTTIPKCLYGVASYALQKPGSQESCTGGSRFSNVPYFYDWITRVMLNG